MVEIKEDKWMKNKVIGFGLTGSFCTYSNAFGQIERMAGAGAEVHTVFSYQSQMIDSRFGRAEDFLERAEMLTGIKPVCNIEAAEPIGPTGMLDIMVICPCTGNTIAKLANGITDSPVLMAAKAHLRNEKPLLISVSTNDALAMNMKNIGLLMNTKNVYFVPFGQDDPVKKPNSMIGNTDMLIPAIEKALKGQQIQPVIVNPK